MYERATLEAVSCLFFGEEGLKVLKSGRDEKIAAMIDLTRMTLREVIPSLRPEFEVRPEIMKVAVFIAGQTLGLAQESPNSALAAERIDKLFREDTPEVFQGTGVMLATINSALASGGDQRMYFATHAGKDWVRAKLDSTRLAGSFASPSLYFDTSLPKEDQWEKKIGDLPVDAGGVLIIGDNFKADIEVPVKKGARGIWVINDQSRGRVAEGEAGLETMPSDVQGRVLRVEETREIIETIIRAK